MAVDKGSGGKEKGWADVVAQVMVIGQWIRMNYLIG